MFPAGSAGVGLLLIRLSIAGMLLLRFMPAQDGSLFYWKLATMLSIGSLVSLGIFTSIAAVLCVSIEIANMVGLRGVGAMSDIPALLVTGAMGLLGPGAFSLDDKWFGRRLLVLPRN